ncbi:MAG: hypothetical protein IJ588_03880 [Prevotella sp.]|nr:hypothetical protein [Prevotella sp.]
MKVDNQDIIRTARELRDEENSRLHVRPWRRSPRFRVPAWLVAVPAAAIVGFFFGLWTNGSQSADAPLTAMVDTVYITVKEPVPTVDTVYRTDAEPSPIVVPVRRVANTKPVHQKQYASVGQSMANDQIRYDLLVKN